MAATTTLMTFLVRAPPTTRSVALLGSWDNFSKAYPMQRDSRLGAEHWTGCHSFNNIICDGDATSAGIARDGGLKMGGTYWYYYKLDDDIEFHSSAEPATTACPLLPGQLVNVLHVPFSLASTRPRNASTSSIASAFAEVRTMNPADKYLNPRPVPVLPRLNTSPTAPSYPFSSTSSPASGSPWTARQVNSSRDTSPPTSSSSLKRFRLPRKSSTVGKPSRSISPGRERVPAVLHSIRNFVSPRSTSPETEQRRGRSAEVTPVAEISGPLLSRRSENSQSPRPTTRTGLPPVYDEHPVRKDSLLLRRRLEQSRDAAEDSLSAASSFQQHRRQRSLSREPSPLRRSLTLEDDKKLRDAMNDFSRSRNGGLEAVKEVNTPQWPGTAIKMMRDGEQVLSANRPGFARLTTDPSASKNPPPAAFRDINSGEAAAYDADLDKRLPTLPNTPSSAYPVSEIDVSPPRQGHLTAAPELQSHFSSTTIFSESARGSPAMPVGSHFSAWTTSTEDSSRIMSDSSFAQTGSLITDLDRSPALSYSTSFGVESPRTSQHGMPDQMQMQIQVGSLPNSNSMASTASCTSIATSADDLLPVAHRFEGLGLAIETDSHDHLDLGSVLPTPLKTLQTYQLPLNQLKSEPAQRHQLQPLEFGHNREQYRDYDQKEQQKETDALLPHSESMRELLEEIGYLRGMIGVGDEE